MDCCWACLDLKLGRSGRPQLIIGSLVTRSLGAYGWAISIYQDSTEHQELFFERCMILHCGGHALTPELQRTTPWLPHWVGPKLYMVLFFLYWHVQHSRVCRTIELKWQGHLYHSHNLSPFCLHVPFEAGRSSEDPVYGLEQFPRWGIRREKKMPLRIDDVWHDG